MKQVLAKNLLKFKIAKVNTTCIWNFTMLLKRNIDIRDMDWPLSILNCKREVNHMKTGEKIEILVKDIDVMEGLIALIDHLSNHSIQKRKKNDHYRLTINKS